MSGPRGDGCHTGLFLAALLLTVALLQGCSSSSDTRTTRFPPAEGSPSSPAAEPVPEDPPPSPSSSYGYLVGNDDCDCDEYSTTDRNYPIGYRFRANYRMEEGFITSITVRFENRGTDTLRLDPGAVMVSSKNVDYQYNNRFLPLPDLVVEPGDSEELNLDGKEVTSAPSWRRIAGETLTLTLRGMRYGEKTLSQQKITFIPQNPHLMDND